MSSTQPNETYGSHVFAYLREPPPDLNLRLIETIHSLRDEFNEGNWGVMAEAVFDAPLPDTMRAYRPVVPGELPDNVLEGARTGFSDDELRRIQDAIAAEQLRWLTVGFDTMELRYRRVAHDYHTFQLRVLELFSLDGASRRPDLLNAVFGSEATLAHALFDRLGAHHAQVEILPDSVDPSSEMMRTLVTWPPHGHWSNYLGEWLRNGLGEPADLRREFVGLLLEERPTGAWTVTLPVDPREAWSPLAMSMRDQLSGVFSRCPPPPASKVQRTRSPND